MKSQKRIGDRRCMHCHQHRITLPWSPARRPGRPNERAKGWHRMLVNPSVADLGSTATSVNHASPFPSEGLEEPLVKRWEERRRPE